MKNRWLPIVLCLTIASLVSAQNTDSTLTSKKLVKKRVSTFLEEGSVIKSQEEIDAMPTRRGGLVIKNLAQNSRNFFIDKFKMPDALDDFKVLPKFSYNSMPLSSLGSMIFPKQTLEDDIGVIQDHLLPTLLVSSDFNQVYLENPTENKYELNVNLLTFMNWALSASAGTEYAQVASASAETAIKKTFSDKKSISIAYGYFQNSLATLFKEVRNSKRLTNKKDFAPLFDLWLQYSANPSAVSDKYIIDGFNALIIEDKREALFLGDNSVNSMAEVKLNIPFLKLNTKTDYSWKSGKEIQNTGSTLSLYFKREPGFIGLLTPAEILETWNYIASDYRTVKYPEGNFLNVSDFVEDELIIKVPFGPIPDNVFSTDLMVKAVTTKILQNTYIDSYEIVGNPVPTEDANGASHLLSIKLKLNKQRLLGATKLTEPLTINTNFEVCFKKTCKIDGQEKRLAITYPLTMYLNTGPAPRVASCKNTSTEKTQSWELSILTSEEVKKLSLNKIDFNLASLSQFSQTLLNLSTLTKDATNPKLWTLKIGADLLERNPSYGEKIPATLTFSLSKNEGDLPRFRSAMTSDFSLTYKEAPKLGEEIVSNSIDNLNLIDNLSDTFKVLDGKSAVTLLKQPALADTTRQKIVNELIKKKVIKSKQGSYSLIKTKL